MIIASNPTPCCTVYVLNGQDRKYGMGYLYQYQNDLIYYLAKYVVDTQL
jgi:hypothetical protein